MRNDAHNERCLQLEHVSLYVLGALPTEERSMMQSHVAGCAECQREMESLTPVLESMAYWPTDVLRPSASLWDRLVTRIGPKSRQTVSTEVIASAPQSDSAPQSHWEEPAAGIFVKLLASDTARDRVNLLVRLAAGVPYPPHIHADVEELYLLQGELWIDDRKLYPGDYNRAEPGSADQRVWSETGCTCILITSSRDVIG